MTRDNRKHKQYAASWYQKPIDKLYYCSYDTTISLPWKSTVIPTANR